MNRTRTLLLLISFVFAVFVAGFVFLFSKSTPPQGQATPSTASATDPANTYLKKYGIAFGVNALLPSTFACNQESVQPGGIDPSTSVLCRTFPTSITSTDTNYTRVGLMLRSDSATTSRATLKVANELAASLASSKETVGGSYACEDTLISSPVRGTERNCILTLKDATKHFFSIFFFHTLSTPKSTLILYTYNPSPQTQEEYTTTIKASFDAIINSLEGEQKNLSWLNYVAQTVYADDSSGDSATGDTGTGPLGGGCADSNTCQRYCTYTGTVAWGSCSGYYSGTTAAGSSVTVYNSAQGYTTTSSATYQCQEGNTAYSGAYIQTSASCVATAQPPQPVTVTLSTFSPSSISTGGSSTISFSSTGATSCSGSGIWSGDLGGTSTSGVSTGPMNTPGTYTQSVTCTGPGGSATSQTQTLTVTTPAAASCTLPWGGTIPSGSSVTAWQSSSVNAPAACVSETRTCTNGTLSGSYTNPNCSVSGSSAPDLAAGSVSPTSVTVSTATSLSSIVSNAGNTSSGASFTNLFQKATDSAGSGATDIGTASLSTLSSGASATASLSYTFSAVGTYYIRVCADKTSSASSGTITESNESNNCGAWTPVTVTSSSTSSCALPWGGTIANGSSVTAYLNASEKSPDTCISETRVCTSGTLSGSYTNQGCSVLGSSAPDLVAGSVWPTSALAGAATSFATTISNAGGVTSGASFTNLLQKATDASGTGATDIGTASMATLAAGASASASISYTPTSSGTLYFRFCADKNSSGSSGTIAESNESNNCGAWTPVTVTSSSPASCTLPWGGTIPSGSSVTAYEAAIVSAPASCVSETRTCTSGTLSGSYTKPSCSVSSCPASYTDVSVTGRGGDATASAWGSNPYTEDSDINYAAVHAGLIAVGQAADIKRTSAGSLASFPGTTAHGVTTGTWSSPWCGVTLSVANGIPTATLSASPTTISAGNSSTLTWSSTNATSCTFADVGTVATSGSRSVSPSTTSIYDIYCTGVGGSSSHQQETVTVVTPTLAISSAPNRVIAGGNVTVTASATDVQSCTVTRNGTLWKSGNANASRTYAPSPWTDAITTQTTYVLSCKDVNGSAVATTAVTVVNVAAGFQEF